MMRVVTIYLCEHSITPVCNRYQTSLSSKVSSHSR